MRVFDERLAALRDRFRALAAEESPPEADVTPGAAIAHVARWDSATADVFRARESDPETEDLYAREFERWNAGWLAEDRDVSPAEALERFESAAARFRGSFEGLNDDHWLRYGLQYALGTGCHYLSHTEQPLEIPLPPSH